MQDERRRSGRRSTGSSEQRDAASARIQTPKRRVRNDMEILICPGFKALRSERVRKHA